MCFEWILNYNLIENSEFSFNDNKNPSTKIGEPHRNLNLNYWISGFKEDILSHTMTLGKTSSNATLNSQFPPLLMRVIKSKYWKY